MSATPRARQTLLDNGLTVVTREQPDAPVAALYLWIAAGAGAERPEEHGIAHFLEHMLFKGTPRRGVGVAASVIEGLGGDLNAWTSTDATVLHATVEASGWAEALDVLSDMALHSVCDDAELQRERQVVLEEIRSYDDDPDNVLTEHVASALFGEHPYGRPILGTHASVSRHTLEAMQAFKAREYTPDRAVLAYVGPVSHGRVLDEAIRLLGPWSGARNGDARRAPPPMKDGPHIVRPEPRFESAAVELAWPAPPLGHPDIGALEVAATLLGQGAAPLLTAALQLDAGLAYATWATLTAQRDAGSFHLGFVPREGSTAEAVAKTLDVVAKLARDCPGLPSLRAREALLADFLFAEETVDGIAYDTAWYTAAFGGPEAREAHSRALATVTPDDVKRVVATWLTPERLVAGVLAPADAPPPELDAAIAAPPRRTGRSREPVRVTHASGARIWVLPDDSPVAAVRLIGLGGGLVIPERGAGIGAAWSRLVHAGAGDRDATAMGEQIDRLAASVDPVVGRNTIGLALTLPASHLRDGIDLLGDLVLDPHLDAEEWERVHEEMLEDLRTRTDRSGEVASDRAGALMWRRHPWRLPTGGTRSSLDRLGPATIRRWHEQQLVGSNLVIVVAGGVDPDTVIDSLSWLDDLPDEPWTPGPRPTPRPRTRGRHVVQAGREQSTVLLMGDGVKVDDPRRHPIDLLTAILGGQSGRLFLDLREKRSLAYSVWAQAFFGVDGGSVSVGLSTDPARADEAATGLTEILAGIVGTPPDAGEMARCARMLVGQSALGLQRASARASHRATTELYGLPWGLDAYREALARVTQAQIVAEASKFLDGKPTELRVIPRSEA